MMRTGTTPVARMIPERGRRCLTLRREAGSPPALSGVEGKAAARLIHLALIGWGIRSADAPVCAIPACTSSHLAYMASYFYELIPQGLRRKMRTYPRRPCWECAISAFIGVRGRQSPSKRDSPQGGQRGEHPEESRASSMPVVSCRSFRLVRGSFGTSTKLSGVYPFLPPSGSPRGNSVSGCSCRLRVCGRR